MYAQVLVELKIKNVDRLFTYSVPSFMQEKIRIGNRVVVPFGSSTLEGFVLELSNTCEIDTKQIIELHEQICLPKELIELGKYMREVTYATLSSCYAAMLPKAIKAQHKSNVSIKYETYLSLNIDYSEALKACRNEKQREIVDFIYGNDKVLKREVQDLSSSSVKTLLTKGILKEIKEEDYRIKQIVTDASFKKELNEEQRVAYDTICKSNGHETFLLYGVTGSGKTEVYMQLIEAVIQKGKEAIVLVPEISLTPQFIYQFKNRFGGSIAVLHSGLSDGEKYDEWRKMERGEVKIVIGARSAVFAPFQNLGIMIIDEEHSDSYKQENNPRYNAIMMAKKRCEMNHIPLVLGSATPTLEAMARAKKGVYILLTMRKRANQNPLPIVSLIDMKEEIKKGNYIFSEELLSSIKETIEKKEQVLLLLNRRGFSTFVSCSSCGYTYKCPYCDITLTYHKTSNQLRCHYCGYSIYKSDVCPNCKEDALNFLGLGTEKVEEELQKSISTAKILRMDKDTTSKKGSHERLLEAFRKEEYNVLLGTQMISKGLDYPKVTLVGVINADLSLNIPDFRSGEKTFALLSQVAGRAGRSTIPGRVLLQTYNKEHYILNCVKNHSYETMYTYEMSLRKKLHYPPYYFLMGIKVAGKNYDVAGKEANKVGSYLRAHLDSSSQVLGPTTASQFKIQNVYYFQIVIKYRFDRHLDTVIRSLDEIYKTNREVLLFIDNDPIHL